MNQQLPPRQALGSRYEIRGQLIGQGATGAVWQAWDNQTDQAVAAKLLWPHYATDHKVLAHFIAEKGILTALNHPGIVRVRDLVFENDQLAIITDLMHGANLAAWLKQQGTLPAIYAVPIAVAILDALDYAHGQGVVHCDVKPANILLAEAGSFTPELVRLADFGIARLAYDPGSQAERIGTANYMAPELISTGQALPATDVYATGVVLYELLAGRCPFAGPGGAVTIKLRHLQSAVPALPIDPALEQVLARMLAKDPADRPTAGQVSTALRALPEHALDAKALPVQLPPEHWPQAPTLGEAQLQGGRPSPSNLGIDPEHAEAEPDTGQPPAEEDPDATALKANLSRLQVAKSPVPPVVAAQDNNDGNSTQMRDQVHHVLEVAAAPEPPARSNKKRMAIVGAGLGVVAITGAVLLATGVFSRNPETKPVVVDTAPAHVVGATLPTGLRIDMDAAYQPDAGQTLLTVSLTAAPSGGLMGNLMLVIPPIVDELCPVVESALLPVEPVRASSDGLDVACAHKLVDVAIPAGQTVTVPLTVDMSMVDSEGSVPSDYSNWLARIDRETQGTLYTATGTVFPLQRVSSLTLTVDAVSIAAIDGTPVPYQVFAQWSDQSEASPPTLLLTPQTLDGSETDLLLSLTGGRGLDAVQVIGCNATQLAGIRLQAMQPTDSCDVQVKVGFMSTPQANLRIRMRQ